IAIGIKDPYNLKAKDIERPSMEIGMFVEVTIHGKVLSDVVALPRNMLREDSTVWSVGSDNKLTIKKVEVMRKEREKVVISGGVEEGEVLVKTNITGAANGMLLRLIEQEEKHD
ncbi:MAG: efflux transporter periplasmic adaptor subunit, partial [Deltaproteobacteria bacterium]|nr:efflux transporter periplasmic adaptor subunit [Deltaproteobacteria bacterium]